MNYSRLMAHGQIEKGDKLAIIDRQGRFKEATARQVLQPGTPQEEVIINKVKNKYFIVAMVLDGSSWAKCVAYQPTGKESK